MPPSPRRASLRLILTVVGTLVLSLALVVSAALVLSTTYLQRESDVISSSLESVRLAQEAQLDLLLHERSRDPVVRRELEGEILGRLAEARAHVVTGAEGKLLDTAELRVVEYVDAARAEQPSAVVSRRLQVGHDALETLVHVNLAQANDARVRAGWMDATADTIAIVIAAVVLLASAACAWWLRTRVFRPVLALADAMERYGRGDRDVRADEEGPTEVRDMAERFNQMATALAARRDAQIAFLGGVAHDLRTPLSALSLTISAIAPEHPLPPEPAIRRAVERVGRQLTRLDRMISDLLDMARVEAGQLELRRRVQDVRGPVREAVTLLASTSRAHTIDLNMPDQPALSEVDALRLEQVVTNLVSNAIKYSPAGGRVEVNVEADGGELHLSVRDEGIGISSEDQERLFEPFQRVGHTRDRIPGVGLGLFVVRRIVEAHRGRFEVCSSPGHGSVFHIWLPLAPALPLETATRVS